PTDRIFSTPYCVDNERLAGSAEAWQRELGMARLRERFGLRPDLPVFLFSGKFVEKKRPGDIVEAMRLLQSRGGPPAQLLLVGEGPLGPQLRAAASGLPVHFAGF